MGGAGHYITNFRHYVQPFPNLYQLGPDLQFFLKHGVVGLLEQGNYEAHGGDFAILKQWVLAKLLWDPTLDARSLVIQFCNEYYSESAPEVLQYIDKLQNVAGDTFMGFKASHLTPLLTAQIQHEGYSLLQQGKAKVADRHDLVLRIENIEVSMLYSIVTGWVVRQQWAMANDQQWPFDKPYHYYCEELSRILQEQKITRITEHGSDIDAERLLNSIRLASPEPKAKGTQEKLERNY